MNRWSNENLWAAITVSVMVGGCAFAPTLSTKSRGSSGDASDIRDATSGDDDAPAARQRASADDPWAGVGGGKCSGGDFEHPFLEIHHMGKSKGVDGGVILHEEIARIADVDGDGDLDVVTVVTNDNGTGVAGWHQNRGDNRFQFVRITGPGRRKALSVAVADLDGDGDLDVVHGNATSGKGWPGGLQVYENLGGGAFKERWLIEGEDATDVVTGDFDGDGNADILYRDNDSTLRWIAKPGTRGGKARALGDTGRIRRLVGAADIDGDGDDDLVYGADDDLGWFEAKKRGRKWKKRNIATSDAMFGEPRLVGWRARLFDWDGDRDIDILAVGGDGVTVLVNADGEGTFAGRTLVSSKNYGSHGRLTHSVAGDVVGDARPEVMLVSPEGGLNSFSFEGEDKKCVSSMAFDRKVPRMRDMAVADIDADGDLDVLVAAWRRNLQWVENGSR